MLSTSCWMLDARCWMLDAGCLDDLNVGDPEIVTKTGSNCFAGLERYQVLCRKKSRYELQEIGSMAIGESIDH